MSEDPRPEGQRFISSFRTKYGGEPDAFNAYSYDAMNVAAAVIRIGGTNRRAVRDAFLQVRDVPTVIFGPANFDGLIIPRTCQLPAAAELRADCDA